ncbi:MFS transporter [Actinokineospora sp. NPDC004072]
MTQARTGVLAVLRATPTPVAYLLGGMLINQLGAFVQTFLILYLTAQGTPIGVAGVCLAAYSVGAIFGGMLGGELTHRLGSRLTIVAAMGATAPLVATIPAVAGAELPWALFAVVGLCGLSTQAYRPAAAVLIADLMPEEHRVMGFSMMRIALNIGAAVAPMVAAVLILVDWNLLFWVDAATAAAWAVLAFAVLPRDVGHGKPESGAPSAPAMSARAVYATMVRDHRFLCFLVASMCGMLVYGASMAVLPLNIIDSGYPTSLYSTVLMISSIVLITCELKITTYIVRIPKRFAGFSGNLVSGVGYLLYGMMAEHPAFVIVGVLLVTSGVMIHGPSTSAHSATFPAPLRGRYLGTRETLMGTGAALGPVLGLAIWTSLGGTAFWGFCALLSLIAGSLHLHGLKQAPAPAPESTPDLEPDVVGEKS